MAGWNYWLDKEVFIISKNSKHPYQGKVIDVDETNPVLIWVVILDKFGKRVQFSAAEIMSIKEEVRK